MTDADFHETDARRVALGQLLFFDPILSGNRNIACATCHHPSHGTGDGVSLGLGEGAAGLGPKRIPVDIVEKRIPRNAPALWNLGARQIDVLFHDGRLSVSDLWDNRFQSPAEEFLPLGLNNILAAQALFPVLAEFEMAGKREENDIAKAARRRPNEAWPLIAQRVRSIPEYGAMLVAAYPDLDSAEDADITHIANALSDFMNAEFRSIDSPYDQYLAGDRTALSEGQLRGLQLFFGKAGCGDCHSGPLLSDQQFHALALPHFGPGRTRRFDPVARDVGRMGETDRLEDAYRFRTPMLRNVALTAPYGHNGAYRTLEGIVRHHLDPAEGFRNWPRTEAVLPSADAFEAVDFIAFQDVRERARLAASATITPRRLSDGEVADIVAFLNGLTGTDSIKGRLGIPDAVPSGLEVDR